MVKLILAEKGLTKFFPSELSCRVAHFRIPVGTALVFTGSLDIHYRIEFAFVMAGNEQKYLITIRNTQYEYTETRGEDGDEILSS
jgi:hypothetical protein